MRNCDGEQVAMGVETNASPPLGRRTTVRNIGPLPEEPALVVRLHSDLSGNGTHFDRDGESRPALDSPPLPQHDANVVLTVVDEGNSGAV
jgi:hypothetical protein